MTPQSTFLSDDAGAHASDLRRAAMRWRDAPAATPPIEPDGPLWHVIGSMRMGAALVAADGRAAWINDAAREAFAEETGVALRDGRVVALGSDLRRKLAVALANACRPPFIDGALLLGLQRGCAAARSLRVLSVERIAGRARHDGEGQALLCIGSARQRAPDAAMLAQLFGLTAAEATLMAGIAGGDRLQRCAERRGVSLATVRAQLRNVFVKTGAATQADLTFIAWSIPGLWID